MKTNLEKMTETNARIIHNSDQILSEILNGEVVTPAVQQKILDFVRENYNDTNPYIQKFRILGFVQEFLDFMKEGESLSMGTNLSDSHEGMFDDVGEDQVRAPIPAQNDVLYSLDEDDIENQINSDEKLAAFLFSNDSREKTLQITKIQETLSDLKAILSAGNLDASERTVMESAIKGLETELVGLI
jgi:hypothetical protein